MTLAQQLLRALAEDAAPAVNSLSTLGPSPDFNAKRKVVGYGEHRLIDKGDKDKSKDKKPDDASKESD